MYFIYLFVDSTCFGLRPSSGALIVLCKPMLVTFNHETTHHQSRSNLHKHQPTPQLTKKHMTTNSYSYTQLNNIQFCFPQITHTYGLQSTFEAPEDGRSPKHVESTNK